MPAQRSDSTYETKLVKPWLDVKKATVELSWSEHVSIQELGPEGVQLNRQE